MQAADLGLAACFLVAVLTAITVVDARSRRIPDMLNAALLLGGLGFQARSNAEFFVQQVAFAVFVSLFFLIVRQAHSAATGMVGLGLGDVKMAGAGSLWFSPPLFPLCLFAASCSALVVVLLLAAGGRPISRGLRIPFGPFLALGILIAFSVENFNDLSTSKDSTSGFGPPPGRG